MKNKFWIVDMPKYSMFVFITLNIIAMLLYPGSNLHNTISIGAENSQEGYSFFDNFSSNACLICCLAFVCNFAGISSLKSSINNSAIFIFDFLTNFDPSLLPNLLF